MIKFNNTDSYHLTQEQAARLTQLSASRPNKTSTEMVSQAIEMGLYAIEYRQKQNRKNSQLKKLGRATLEQVNSVKNGLAARALAKSVGLIIDEGDDDAIIDGEEVISLDEINEQ